MFKKLAVLWIVGVLLVAVMYLLLSMRLGHTQELPKTVLLDSGIQQIAAEIYANDSFARVRGSASAQAQINGSSMVVTYQEKKYILTNFHVVKSMVDVYIEDLKTGNVYPSRVVGRDPVLDLALLTLPQELQHLVATSFAEAMVGETVFAIGFPFGERSITIGYISSMELVSSMFLLSQVPLNQGNSGGPLLNAKQEVVGINTAYRPQANLYSFSVPSSYVQRILPQLVEGGTVRHAHPKLAVTDSRDLLPRNFADLGISYPMKRTGVVIIGFQDESASQQGIEMGDIILSIDGVRTESVRQYAQLLLFSYKSGQRAKLLLLRGTEEVTVEVKLSPLTAD